MAEQDRLEIAEAFTSRWRRWAEIVRLFVLRQRGRYDVDPAEYDALHRELLAACRQKQRAGSDLAAQPFYRELEEMLAPWVTLDSLGWAERDIVYQLSRRAEKAERLLQGRRAVDFNWKRLGLGLLGVAVLVMVVAALLLVRSGMASSWPAAVTLPRWLRTTTATVHEWTVDQPLLVCGAVVTLIVIVLVWISARRS